jgi:hypothetical protein
MGIVSVIPMVISCFAAAGDGSAADQFSLPADPQFSIVDSIQASVRFVTQRCLVVEGDGLRANSTFVDPEGRPALWHEFGPLEGVGWAANAVGGANELIRVGRFFRDRGVEEKGLKVLHHAVYGGFVDGKTGFLRGYRDTRDGRYHVNYLHDDRHNDWFCPGSAAKVALQYLEAGDLCKGTKLGEDSRACGLRLAGWLRDHVRLAPNGWFPRRCGLDGKPYRLGADGRDPDPQFDHSGDGLYLLWLFADMTRRGNDGYRSLIERPLNAFVKAGGFFGSMNHDTYDDSESVCYAVAFRTLLRIADWGLCADPAKVRRFAYEKCLTGLEQFEMREDRNGVATRGLLFMEKSWDTAYLWENAEAATAYIEAAKETGRKNYLGKGVTILRAIAKHHYGPYGFLTEGVDWNNHNAQWRVVDGKNVPIHVGGVVYGAVNYTEPFLNNLQIVEPTLLYLEHIAQRSSQGGEERWSDHEGNVIWRRGSPTTR